MNSDRLDLYAHSALHVIISDLQVCQLRNHSMISVSVRAIPDGVSWVMKVKWQDEAEESFVEG